MGTSRIDGIGKVGVSQGTGFDIVKRQEEVSEVMFADMFSMNNKVDLENFSANSSDDVLSSVKPADAYEKYQYKDKTIRSNTNDNTNGEKTAKEIEEFRDAVAEEFEEKLGVSKEELEKAMEELGLTYLDLLDNNNLASLAAELTGCEEISELLNNEDFMELLQEMKFLGGKLLNDLQMTPEEFVENFEALNAVVETEDSAEQDFSDSNNQSLDTLQMPQTNEHVVVNEIQTTAFAEQLGEFEAVQTLPPQVTVADIMEQFAEQTRVLISADTTKLEMQLNPEHLGKLYLEVLENDGVITAKLQTQNAEVKEALEMQVTELKLNLEQAGVKVDSVEVTIASHEFERNLEQDANSKKQQEEALEKKVRHRNINLNELDGLSGLMSEEETLVVKMMAEQGNSVNFIA